MSRTVEPDRTGRVLSTRPVRRPGPFSRGASAVDTVSTSWLLVVCSMVVWSLAPVIWGWQPNLVVTGSMMPKLKPGDVVMVASPTLDRPVQRGQVVLVGDPEAATGRVLHRVVRVGADGTLTTQGDANPSPDVHRHGPDEVVGVARLVVPGAGRLALLLAGVPTTPRDRGWAAVTLLALALFVGARLRTSP